MNLETLRKRYLDGLTGRFKAKTVKTYAERLSRFAAFLAKEKIETLLELDAKVLLRYPATLGSLGVNSRYVYLDAAKLFCGWLTDENFVFVNPAAGLALPKWKRFKRPNYTVKQVQNVLKKVTVCEPILSRDKALLGLHLLEGLSAKELAALTVLDVDVSGKELRRATQKKFQVLQTASVTTLRDLLKKRPLFVPKSDYLFLTAGGIRMTPGKIRRVIGGYL